MFLFLAMCLVPGIPGISPVGSAVAAEDSWEDDDIGFGDAADEKEGMPMDAVTGATAPPSGLGLGKDTWLSGDSSGRTSGMEIHANDVILHRDHYPDGVSGATMKTETVYGWETGATWRESNVEYGLRLENRFDDVSADFKYLLDNIRVFKRVDNTMFRLGFRHNGAFGLGLLSAENNTAGLEVRHFSDTGQFSAEWVDAVVSPYYFRAVPMATARMQWLVESDSGAHGVLVQLDDTDSKYPLDDSGEPDLTDIIRDLQKWHPTTTEAVSFYGLSRIDRASVEGEVVLHTGKHTVGGYAACVVWPFESGDSLKITSQYLTTSFNPPLGGATFEARGDTSLKVKYETRKSGKFGTFEPTLGLKDHGAEGPMLLAKVDWAKTSGPWTATASQYLIHTLPTNPYRKFAANLYMDASRVIAGKWFFRIGLNHWIDRIWDYEMNTLAITVLRNDL